MPGILGQLRPVFDPDTSLESGEYLLIRAFVRGKSVFLCRDISFFEKKIGLIKGVGCKVVEKFPLSCLKSALDYCNGLAPIQKFFIISKNQLFHTDFVNHMTEFKFSFF